MVQAYHIICIRFFKTNLPCSTWPYNALGATFWLTFTLFEAREPMAWRNVGKRARGRLVYYYEFFIR